MIGINIDAGSNLLSFNVVPPGGMSVASVLGHLSSLDPNTFIEDPSNPPGCHTNADIGCSSALWTGSAWIGDLSELDATRAYRLKAEAAATLAYTGDDLHDGLDAHPPSCMATPPATTSRTCRASPRPCC